MKKPDIPIIECTISDDGVHASFWCPHCRGKHSHGAAGGEGHRAAHCWRDDSPYLHTGYVLRFKRK